MVNPMTHICIMRLLASAGRCGSVEKVWDSGDGWLGHPKGKNSMAAYKSNRVIMFKIFFTFRVDSYGIQPN